MSEFANIPLDRITASLTNPRKHFNPATLAELAESIRTSGVHTPVLVRPLPGSRLADTERSVQYELVAGERRYRASEMAGAATIPALVRALTDDQVLEIQIIENLQRDDLTELEEAEGYERLMEHAHINADEVGAKIGKSRSYVYARLKLLDLSIECKTAMRAGQIDASRALLIARIPSTELQAKALQEATREDYRGDVPSVRALQSWLQANVMLRLDQASFKITDSRLVKSAGSCKDCPKRTGANPDLFADVSSADICTDPGCFHSKEDAQRASMLATAAAKGMRFIEGAEAREICSQYRNVLDGYSPLSQVRNDIVGEDEIKLGVALGKDSPPAVLIENPWTKELIAAVPTEEAEAVLLSKGLIKVVAPAPAAPRTAKQLEQNLQALQSKVERRTQIEVDKATMTATVGAIRSTTDEEAKALLGNSALLRAWLNTQMDNQSEKDMATALGYKFDEGEDEQDALVQCIKSSSLANLCRATVVLMVTDEQNLTYSDDIYLVRNQIMRTMDVDDKALTKAATKAVRDEFADEAKELQALIDAQKKPPAAPAPTAPLAQPNLAPGSATKGVKKQKLSAQDAISGIAAAMQGAGDAASAPEGAVALPATTLAIGVPVKITSELSNPRQQKYAGKSGTITGKVGAAWDVTFKGRTGGISSFTADQLTVVVA